VQEWFVALVVMVEEEADPMAQAQAQSRWELLKVEVVAPAAQLSALQLRVAEEALQQSQVPSQLLRLRELPYLLKTFPPRRQKPCLRCQGWRSHHHPPPRRSLKVNS